MKQKLLCLLFFISLFSLLAKAEPASTKAKELLNFFTFHLKTSQKTLNYDNHEYLASHQLCSYLQSLKSIEEKESVPSVSRFEFLSEMILFYDKILDINDQSLVVSCLYNYYQNSQAEELFNLTNQLLSPYKQKKLFELLSAFERTELEGNGDNLNTDISHLFKIDSSFDRAYSDNRVMSLSSGFNYIQSHSRIFFDSFMEYSHYTEFLAFFVDTLFQNTDCFCQGNDACTRGCLPKNLIQNRKAVAVKKCVGKKNISTTKNYCARHVNAAITNTIEAFFSPFCSKMFSHLKGYKQCVADFKTDISNKHINICQHAFIFPSALCMLNLSGEDFSIYNKISNKHVRKTCKNWDLYNKNLYSFSSPYLNHGKISMFKKIPNSEYSLFIKNPSKIPVGAIIVSKSLGRHGHVEVRTDKVLCGKNKDKVCFCSDYCQERKQYSWPHQILAVYEWNPEFLKYIDQTLYASIL